MTFERISASANRLGGAPCVRDLRFPVATIVMMVADGMTVDEILAEHPDLEEEDVAESMRFAAFSLQDGRIPSLRQQSTHRSAADGRSSINP